MIKLSDKWHCVSMTRRQYEEFLLGEMDAFTLCGRSIGGEKLGPCYFAGEFAKITKEEYACKKCCDHPDLPLLVLSFLGDL